MGSRHHCACWLCFFYSCGFVEHVFVRFKRYFHPSETRVNRVVTRAWFQDSFRVLRCFQRSWTHQVFLFCNIQNLQIHKMCHMKKGIPIMYVVGFEWERTGSVTVESTQSWPVQILWWRVHKVDLTKSITHVYRFHGNSSSLRLLTMFLLLMWVCGTCVCQV